MQRPLCSVMRMKLLSVMGVTAEFTMQTSLQASTCAYLCSILHLKNPHFATSVRRDARFISAKKTGHFSAENVILRSTKPMSTPRNTVGFFSQESSSLLSLLCARHPPPLTVLTLAMEGVNQPRSGKVQSRSPMKCSVLLQPRYRRRHPLHIMSMTVRVVRFQRVAYPSTWRQFLAGMSMTYLTLRFLQIVFAGSGVHHTAKAGWPWLFLGLCFRRCS